MLRSITFLISILIVMVGYLIGSYFVDFALKRVDISDINSAPAAAENIRDNSIFVPEKPNFTSENWTTISEDGLNLNATHFLPHRPSHQWAILVHGYGRDQRYAWDYAEAYLKQGYEVLTPDLRAAGTSEGIYVTMGGKESDDILLWIEKILQVDSQAEIILHGVSMGAATVLMAASKSQSLNLKAVIEDCAYTSAFGMFSMQLDKIFNLPSFPIMNFVDIVSKFKTGISISEAAPINYVKNINVPILFIHGTEDKLVPYYMMQELYDACHSPVKEIFSAEGADHAGSKNLNPNSYYRRIFSFIDQYNEDYD